MITVNVVAATICFLDACYPALVGDNTPTGTFHMIERVTDDPGYGGNVIQFYETKQAVYAIHRVWTVDSSQRRMERIQSSDPQQRFITSGCINVEEKVFEKILDCCMDMELKIKR